VLLCKVLQNPWVAGSVLSRPTIYGTASDPVQGLLWVEIGTAVAPGAQVRCCCEHNVNIDAEYPLHN
jgi:hypothetical protein